MGNIVLASHSKKRWKEKFVVGSAPGEGDLPEDCHPKIQQIVCYWRSIHPENGLPAREQLDPVAFFRLLPDVRLVDVVGEPPRFRVRLTGERIRQHIGHLHTGLFFDDVFASFADRASCLAFTTAARTKRPYWNRGSCELIATPVDAAAELPVERVVLPLAGDGATVDTLLILALLGPASR